MSSFFSFLTKKKFPNTQARQEVLSGPFTAMKAVVYTLFLAILVVSYLILIELNSKLLVTIPAHGGTITEGIIGSPHFINPILAVTETDTALTNLVYAGLMKEQSDRTLIPELAQSYEISPDGRVYTFVLKDKLFFHDGSALTSSDVAFTVEKMQDPDLNERTASYWQNINVETPDQRTIVLSLLLPDTDFLHKMTIGILPAARWQGVIDEAFVDPSLNLSPIGAGPFKFEDIEFDSSGAPEEISFVRYKNYALGTPYIQGITLSIFANQDELLAALINGSIDVSFIVTATSLTDTTKGAFSVTEVPTNTSVQLLRRSNEEVFQNPAFLSAITHFIDNEQIIATVENGYGIPETERISSFDETVAALGKLGYIYTDGTLYKGSTPVIFSLATDKDPEHIAVSQQLALQLKKIGITVSAEVYDQGSFQNGIDHAQFPIILVENTIPLPNAYVSGIPLYTKTILITARNNIHGIQYEHLQSRARRYTTVTEWFTKTDRVWKFLKINT